MVWRREKLVYDGDTVQVPLPEGEGTGLGKPLKLINHPVRSDIPIWWASLMGKSVEATAEVADGWLPIMFIPEQGPPRLGRRSCKAGLAKRSPDLAPLEISAGGLTAIGEDLVGDKADHIRDFARPSTALYVGGMGARGKNFYNDLARRYGYVDEAVEIQDLYLDGKKDEAAAAVPAEWLEKTSLVGPGVVREGARRRLQGGRRHRAGGEPDRADAVKTIESPPRHRRRRVAQRSRWAWSSRMAARQTVRRSAVGRWRYSSGPWALLSGPSTPVITNWASGNRSPSMPMNGMDPPSP